MLYLRLPRVPLPALPHLHPPWGGAMTSGYIRVPNVETYARNTYQERQRLYAALKALLGDYAMSEIERGQEGKSTTSLQAS